MATVADRRYNWHELKSVLIVFAGLIEYFVGAIQGAL